MYFVYHLPKVFFLQGLRSGAQLPYAKCIAHNLLKILKPVLFLFAPGMNYLHQPREKTTGGSSMKNMKLIFWRPAVTITALLGLFNFWMLLAGCAGTKPQYSVSQYIFNYNDEKYRIRTIHAENKLDSYNEIIGKTFLAADFDQDRVIDQIIMGSVDPAEVQVIYEYGLMNLSKENKLLETNPNIQRYVYQSIEFDYEIKTFQPAATEPFNEFTIIDKRSESQVLSTYIDLGADGTLDNTVKGTAGIVDIQPTYSDILISGMQKGKLVKSDGKILVGEK
jgi:hypothetical protein